MWVGKSKRKADNKKYFSNIAKASDIATHMFEDRHLDFDSSLEEGEAGYDYELSEEYNTIIETNETNVEFIRKSMEKFVV